MSANNAGNSGLTGARASLSQASSWTSSSSRMDPTSVVVFSAVCVVLMVIIIVYIVWRIRRSDLKSITLVKDPLRLYGSSAPITINQSKFPATLNGQEYSFGFWLYLVEYTPTNTPMLIFGRGVQQGGGGGSPLVYLDPNTNKMYVSVMLNGAANTGTKLASVATSKDYVTAVVDYVPLQRWVNVAVVLQDYLMSVFVDGELYAVENVTDTDAATNAKGARAIFGSTSGDLTVGSSAAQVTGFLSQLQFFNFALTRNDVKQRYAGGPTAPSPLAALGIPAYGIRSPVYKID